MMNMKNFIELAGNAAEALERQTPKG